MAPKNFSSYFEASLAGGWRSNCPRSPLAGIPGYAATDEWARENSFSPTQKRTLLEYVIVQTSHCKGYVGFAEKYYYSVYGRDHKKEATKCD